MIAKTTLFQLAKTLGGLAVLGCLPGTPAAQAGIRYGDILLFVNGRATRSFGDFVEAKALRADGMHVVLFRAGQEHPITLEYQSNRGIVDPVEVLTELMSMRTLSADVEGEGSAS